MWFLVGRHRFRIELRRSGYFFQVVTCVCTLNSRTLIFSPLSESTFGCNVEMTHVLTAVRLALCAFSSIALRRCFAHVQRRKKLATLKLQNMRKRRFDDRMKAATSTVRQTNIHISRRLLITLQWMKWKDSHMVYSFLTAFEHSVHSHLIKIIYLYSFDTHTRKKIKYTHPPFGNVLRRAMWWLPILFPYVERTVRHFSSAFTFARVSIVTNDKAIFDVNSIKWQRCLTHSKLIRNKI